MWPPCWDILWGWARGIDVKAKLHLGPGFQHLCSNPLSQYIEYKEAKWYQVENCISMTYSFFWSINFISANTQRNPNPSIIPPCMFAQGLGSQLCLPLKAYSFLIHDLSTHLNPFIFQSVMNPVLFFALMFSCSPSLRPIIEVEGRGMDRSELVRKGQKRKCRKMEMEENEANALLSWQRYFRKMGSNLMEWKQVLPFTIKSRPSSQSHINWNWSLLK